jgi:hypothetical protein
MGSSSHLHLNINGKDIIVIVPNVGVINQYNNKVISLSFNGNVVNLFSKVNEKNLEYIEGM